MIMQNTVHKRKRGAALVVTLVLVVLITMMLLAFFVNTTLNGQLEVSSTTRMEANVIGRSALELVVSDLRKEMLASSVQQGNALIPDTNAITLQPYRVLSDVNTATNLLFNTLVKQSTPRAGMFPTTLAAYGHNGVAPTIALGLVSDISTLSAARNGRKLSLERWSYPQLIVGSNGASNVFTDGTQAPNWIYMGSSGVTNVANAGIIGRFAFNVYNVGGLLNINVAGSPAGLSDGERNRLKGTPVGAVMSNSIPGVNREDDFVSWRNFYSAPLALSGGTNYVNKVIGDVNGFRQPLADNTNNPTLVDNRFVSRQDLIRYVRLHPDVMDAKALPYLTTFSMELNRPSWYPMTNVGGSFNYKDGANNILSANRDLRTVNKSDGLTPLMPERFPLSKLGAVPSSGAGLSSAGEDAMLSDFGLVWNDVDKCWEYSMAISGRIRTLAEVVADNDRSPNFFEILKAGIFLGSLGKSTAEGISANKAYEEVTDHQIIQIGCNMIDQYRGDDFPTKVRFDSAYPVFSGVVDLPYVNKIYSLFYHPREGESVGSFGTQPANRGALGFWLVPEFWRTHKRSAYGSTAPASEEIRLRVANGRMRWEVQQRTNPSISNDVNMAGRGLEIPITGSEFRDVPDVVRTGSAQNIGADAAFGSIVDPSFSGLRGIPVAFTIAVMNYGSLNNGMWKKQVELAQPDPAIEEGTLRDAFLYPTPGERVNFTLEVKDSSGNWSIYDTIKNYQNSSSVILGLKRNGSSVSNPDFVNTYSAPDAPSLMNYYLRGGDVHGRLQTGNALRHAILYPAVGRVDPRSDRFGLSAFLSAQRGFMKASFKSGPAVNSDPQSMPVAGAGENSYEPTRGGQKAYQATAVGRFNDAGWSNGFTPSPGTWQNRLNGNYPGALTDNTGASGTMSYQDRDGVGRRALGAYSTYLMDDASRSPVMLNRPFNSVGDLGFVHRGEPWKNLDLFTAQSADAGLLDIFSATDQGEIVEGKIDLNSAPEPVLASYISGTVSNEMMLNSVVDPATAAAIAKKIRDEVKRENFANKSELVTRFGDSLSTRPSSEGDKMRQEAYVRGLADNVQTRTWNLMIDLVAQKGRLASPTDLASFVVEGERRYWLHIAIDRLTGQIIGQRLETVYE